MVRAIVVVCALATFALTVSAENKPRRAPIQPLLKEIHEDAGLNIEELITKYGYPCEVHSDIQTQDGYLLTMHRIPHGKDGKHAEKGEKPVVFLQHGLLSSSVDWLNMGPQLGIAYQLADLGYDVWMGNARGNTHSKAHVSLSPSDSDFWMFSWHQIGIYDLPAMIDHVLGITGDSQLFYIGHSQGTTSFFIMCAERPEYNDKIRLMMAFAPVAYMSRIDNLLLKVVAQFEGVIDWIADMLGANEFLPSTGLLELGGSILCQDNSPFQEICANVLFILCGWDSEQLNRTMLPVIVTNAPAGASTKQLVHYAQEINSGHFRQWDYGWIENLIEYGSLSPPDYNIGKITAPVALFYSQNDRMAGVPDVDQLYKELPNAVYKYNIPLPAFNHLDFLWAIDVNTLLHERVYSIMQNF